MRKLVTNSRKHYHFDLDLLLVLGHHMLHLFQPQPILGVSLELPGLSGVPRGFISAMMALYRTMHMNRRRFQILHV